MFWESGMEGGSVYPAPASTGTNAAVKQVHLLRFFTPAPLDHCARVLDAVRRMGFDLVSIWAQPSPTACFVVRLNFVPKGELAPSLLADRVSGFVGVTGVEMSAL